MKSAIAAAGFAAASLLASAASAQGVGVQAFFIDQSGVLDADNGVIFLNTDTAGNVLSVAGIATDLTVQSVPVAVTNLQFTTWGLWASVSGPQYGAFAGGLATNLAEMPRFGTAQYLGSAIARATVPQGIFDSVGNASVIADFGNQTVGWSVGQFTSPIVPDMAGAGTISGNLYGGQLKTVVGAPVVGEFAGKFIGPSAIETGGVFSASGINAPLTLVGSFGARRQ